MGLFDLLFTKKQENKAIDTYLQTVTAYQPVFSSWNGKLYESELVRSAIDARARHIAKLKVELVGKGNERLRTRLKKKPNEFMTWYQFMYRLSTILDMQNSAFIVPQIGQYGEVTGFYPVLPSMCEIKRDKSGKLYVVYTFSYGERAAIEFELCGIMTKFQYSKEFFGEDNRALDSTMDIIGIQKQGIKEAIKNGASYRFMAKASNFSKTEDLAKERLRFSAKNLEKDAKGGGILLFPNTYTDIQQIKASPYTVDPEQTKIIQSNVYNYYGVNEDILQNKAYGDEWSAFYEGAVEPFAIQFSEVMRQIVFTEKEIAYGCDVVATANRLQYLSNSDKLSVSAQMADRGLMTINEIREIWNLPPVDGGDIRTIRGEYYTVDNKGNVVERSKYGYQRKDFKW